MNIEDVWLTALFLASSWKVFGGLGITGSIDIGINLVLGASLQESALHMLLI